MFVKKDTGIHTLLADHYRENLKELMEDEIVVHMADEVVCTKNIELIQKFVDQKMMSAVNAEYHTRGGINNGSLGAVSWAVSELIQTWSKPHKTYESFFKGMGL